MTKIQVPRPWRWLTLLLLLSACGGGGGGGGSGTGPSPSPPPVAGPLSLTVVNGWGPASLAAASSFEVWADVQPLSEVVTGWTGGTVTSDADEWHATAMAGNTPPTLTANKLQAPVNFETLIYRTPTTVGKTARFFIPAAPKGLVLMLHGSGGTSAFIERTESRYLALKAISQGYAVLAPEAEESVAGDLDGDGKQRWNVPLSLSNVDLQSLNALLDGLYLAGRLPAGLPQYVLGMSNGGSMAVALAAVGDTNGAAAFPRLRFKAAVSYCAQARADAVAVTRTPTAWYLCGNDDNAEVSNTNAQANSASLAGRGVPTAALLHAATPLYDERFLRVLGVSLAQSGALSAELRAAGMLDAAGFFNLASADVAARATASLASFPVLMAMTATQQRGVISQIAVMRAEHEMYADWAGRTLRWFAAYP